MATSLVCGIDLGTSNSLCAVSYGSTQELVNFGSSKTAISSTVQYDNSGAIFVGVEGGTKDSVTIRSAKLIIGTPVNEMGELAKFSYGSEIVELADHCAGFLIRRHDKEERISPIDVEAEILREIRYHINMYVSDGRRKLSTVVVGVPAKFNQLQREFTLAACRKVFEAPINVKLLDEPVAAIIHYFESNQNFEPGYYLVYDFGSGTFDLTLVKCEKVDIYDIKERDGDDKIGGIDIDQALLEYVLLISRVKYNFDLEEMINKSERKKAELLKRCEELKMVIVARGQGSIDITEFIPRENRPVAATDDDDDDDDEVFITIDKPTFNVLIQKIVEKTTKMIDKLLEKYNKDDIKAIILVGGTTSIPFIAETLRKKYQININENISNTDCVAKGACIYAEKEGNLEPSSSGVSAIEVKTTSKCSFGVAVLGGKICPLINRGEQLPCKKSKLFTTTEDDQQVISTAIYEGEGDFQKNCRLIKTIIFDGIKKARKGVPRIQITYEVDAFYNLTVTCSEMISETQFKPYISETLTVSTE